MFSRDTGRRANIWRQLAINGWVIAMLILGFAVSLAIPKMTIPRLGEAGYGIYALIIGFSGILAFADLGLIPGLTRELAKPALDKDVVTIVMALRWLDRVMFVVSILLSTSCMILMLVSLHSFDSRIYHAFTVFVVATFFTARADIRAALLRVSGSIKESYVLRGIYLLTFLGSIWSASHYIAHWNGVVVVFYAQLSASLVYYCSVALLLKRRLDIPVLLCMVPSGKVAQPACWRGAWYLSSPERLGRGVQLIAGAIERPLLLITGGLAVVTSYDLLMRLTLLVTAIPGAISQPLLAMLVHDSTVQSTEGKYSLALPLTRLISLTCAILGLVVAVVLFAGYHQQLFHIRSRIPLLIGVLVAVVAGINAQTAPGSASQIARGIVGPSKMKLYIEGGGLMLGGVCAFLLHNGFIFIVVRNCALGFAAVIFLVSEKCYEGDKRQSL